MRCFVGCWLPAPVRDHLAATLDGLRPWPTSLRRVDPERWHLTLAFLGDVELDELDRAHRALAEVSERHAPVTGLTLAGAGIFGAVLWIGLPDVERGHPLDRLARDVQRSMRAVRIPVERRPWRPHVTVARSRGSAYPRSTARLLERYAGPEWGIAEFALVESQTGPLPSYTELERWRITGE